MFSAGRVTEEIRHTRGIAEAVFAEATSVWSQVESRVASLVAQAKVSTAQAVGALSKCVEEVAAHLEEQTSCVVGTVAQQLEKNIEVAAVSPATTSERNTCLAVNSL